MRKRRCITHKLNMKSLLRILFELTHDKGYNKTCATTEDSDKPVHPHSPISVFADRMCLFQPPGYLKRDKREPVSYCVTKIRLFIYIENFTSQN